MIQDLAKPVQQSRDAFLRNLPKLLSNPKHTGWWAAFHGEQCLGVNRLPQELLRDIHQRGFSEESCFLGVIRPHEPEPEDVQPRGGHHFADDE